MFYCIVPMIWFWCMFLLLWETQQGLGALEDRGGENCLRRDTYKNLPLSEDGDVVIGGAFNVHYQVPTITNDYTQAPLYQPCNGLDNTAIQFVYAMIYAVEEINRSKRLMPGVKMGYRILDCCGRPPWALEAVLSLIGGDAKSCISEDKSYKQGFVPVIIGGPSSSTSIVLSRVLKPFSVPLISYFATCPCLSDRQQYPNFFRTIPSDVYQARALAQLVMRFQWTWIGAVVTNSAYGQEAIKIFEEETAQSVCLAFVKTFKRESIIADLREAALTIKASNAKVILIFSLDIDVGELFVQLQQINVTDRQFLATEAWSTSGDLLQHSATSKVAHGVFGVAIRSSNIEGFENYITSLQPSQRPNDEFLREFWEKVFGCAPLSSSSSPLPLCNGTESLFGVQRHFTDMSQLRVTYNVYLAVYAAAYAIHSLLSCPDTEASVATSNCSSPQNITPAQLLEHLSTVNFTTPQGERFYFQGGDIPAKYDLINWQKTPEGSLKLVLIGKVDGFDIDLNETMIQWSTGTSQVPISVCTMSCQPGTRKAIRKGEPVCCFDCIPCGDGEVSNKTDSLQCDRCPLEFWSNPGQTSCVPRQLDFLAFNETLGITLTTVAVSGAVLTTAVFVVFLYHRQTPMVRANNSELSFLLLMSLKLCFLCSLVFIGRPSVWSCRFQQAAFGISFVLSVSCLQVKTMVVLGAFRSARPGGETFVKWFGPRKQRMSVWLLTWVQIIICIVWLCVSPPKPHMNLNVPGRKVTLECAMTSVLGFSLVLGYIGLLACTCLLLAFLARKLPDNFNEAKLITFSMLIFCAVWVAFVPAYVSSPGKYSVAVEIFAILASTYGVLFCIFAPKCFIILLKPQKNTKKYVMRK